MGFDKLIEQYLVDGNRCVAIRAMLKSAQGRGAGQGLDPRGGGLQGQVVAQFVVIVQVFVTQGQGVDPLAQQLQQGVITAGLTSTVHHGPGRQGQPHLPINLGE